MKPPAVVLLSGGLDSAVTLAHCVKEGFAPHALTIDYGQRHRVEIDSARRVAQAFSAENHIILPVPLSTWGGSALTDDIPVPEGGEASTEIPATYVPARNTVFLSLALAWAETLSSGDVFIGVNAVDYSGYPDCRPEYIQAFQNMAALATRDGVGGRAMTIHTPLISMSKAQIIQHGTELGLDFSITHSCYNPDEKGRPCGRCDSCRLRLAGFQQAGLSDPLDYLSAQQ